MIVKMKSSNLLISGYNSRINLLVQMYLDLNFADDNVAAAKVTKL